LSTLTRRILSVRPKYLYFYFWQYKIPYIALRYANVYGPRQDPKGEAGVVAIFCQNLIANKESVIFGNGRQTRDFVYVEDVARANLRALKSRLVGEINIGTSKETDINNLYKMLDSIANFKIAQPKYLSAKLGEQKRSSLDIKKAKKILNWKPELDFKVGLEKTLQYYQKLSS